MDDPADKFKYSAGDVASPPPEESPRNVTGETQELSDAETRRIANRMDDPANSVPSAEDTMARGDTGASPGYVPTEDSE